MTYAVKEIYYTLQGEGARTGRGAVFCRFAGCNLWSGLERDRARAVCGFCDTDFVGTDGPGGGRFTSAEALADAIDETWRIQVPALIHRYVVCTGGEPLLQLDAALVAALHERGFEVAIETNGTCSVPAGVDWICVSPKSTAEVIVRHGNELKLVYPQHDAKPAAFEHLQFDHFFLQPMDGPDRERNTELTMQYCRQHPKWRLSLQVHKLLGIP